jgi:hypothetical protein
MLDTLADIGAVSVALAAAATFAGMLWAGTRVH